MVLTQHLSAVNWGNVPVPDSACTPPNCKWGRKNIHTSDTSGQHDRDISNLHILSPGTHKVEVTGGVVVGNVPSKLRNAGLVVVPVLGVELHVAVAEQKNQLHDEEEEDGYKTNMKFCRNTKQHEQ